MISGLYAEMTMRTETSCRLCALPAEARVAFDSGNMEEKLRTAIVSAGNGCGDSREAID
jgi:hypothetical protein